MIRLFIVLAISLVSSLSYARYEYDEDEFTAKNANNESNSSSLQGKSILLVEDDPLILSTYEIKLKSNGVSVKTATSLEEAKEKVANNKFDIIFTDLNLTTGLKLEEGFKLIKFIRSVDTNVPVVLVTGESFDSNQLTKLWDLGFSGYQNKLSKTAPLNYIVHSYLSAKNKFYFDNYDLINSIYDFNKDNFAVGEKYFSGVLYQSPDGKQKFVIGNVFLSSSQLFRRFAPEGSIELWSGKGFAVDGKIVWIDESYPGYNVQGRNNNAVLINNLITFLNGEGVEIKTTYFTPQTNFLTFENKNWHSLKKVAIIESLRRGRHRDFIQVIAMDKNTIAETETVIKDVQQRLGKAAEYFLETYMTVTGLQTNNELEARAYIEDLKEGERSVYTWNSFINEYNEKINPYIKQLQQITAPDSYEQYKADAFVLLPQPNNSFDFTFNGYRKKMRSFVSSEQVLGLYNQELQRIDLSTESAETKAKKLEILNQIKNSNIDRIQTKVANNIKKYIRTIYGRDFASLFNGLNNFRVMEWFLDILLFDESRGVQIPESVYQNILGDSRTSEGLLSVVANTTDPDGVLFNKCIWLYVVIANKNGYIYKSMPGVVKNGSFNRFVNLSKGALGLRNLTINRLGMAPLKLNTQLLMPQINKASTMFKMIP